MTLAFVYLCMGLLIYEVTHPEFQWKALVSTLPPSPSMASTEEAIDESYMFKVPRKLWVAEADGSYLSKLIAENNRRVAEESDFVTIFVNQENFRTLVSETAVRRIEALNASAEVMVRGRKRDEARTLISTFILLHVLH